MYADDIVLLSSSAKGLQERLNKLYEFCQDWCLEVNVSKKKKKKKKKKVLIFNKLGRLVENTFFFNSECLENVRDYRHFDVYFQKWKFQFWSNRYFQDVNESIF